MKLIATLLLVASTYANAQLTCDGQEVVAEGSAPGRIGQVLVGQNPFYLKWADDALEMTGKHTLCGVVLNRSTLCQTVDTSAGPRIATRMMCADVAINPLENKVGEAYFAYDLSGATGRFGCSHAAPQEREKANQVIELKNCR